MKLSYRQKADLKSLLDPGSGVARRSLTNSTLSALERRGLAKIVGSSEDGFSVFRWHITDAGRAALSVSRPQGEAS